MARIVYLLSLGFCMTMGTNAQAQPALQITEPPAGTVINPGQTVVVTVSASGGPFSSVGIVVPGYVYGSDILDSPPYQFSFTMPVSGITPGLDTIAALGNTPSGLVSTYILIDVERPDSPQSVATSTSQIELPIGGTLPIGVYGTYGDGSIVDLSKSTQTTYTSQNAGIATVTATGLVTAIAPGITRIVVDGSIAVAVTVDPPIRMIPTQATLTASQSMEFTALTVGLASSHVTWSLSPAIGSIDTDGKYTAPVSLDSQQTVTLTATSVADSTLTASAVITLSPAASVTVLPAWAVLYPSQPQQFSAPMSNAGTAGVTWSISPAGAGTIDGTGRYTAPASISTTEPVTITATSAASPAISGSTTIYISPQPFAILPFQGPAVNLGQGTSSRFVFTLLATDRFTHPIVFSAFGLPSGVAGFFTPPSLTGGSTNITLNLIAASAVPGTYTVTVVAQDTVYAPLSRSLPFTLNIVAGSRPH